MSIIIKRDLALEARILAEIDHPELDTPEVQEKRRRIGEEIDAAKVGIHAPFVSHLYSFKRLCAALEKAGFNRDCSEAPNETTYCGRNTKDDCTIVTVASTMLPGVPSAVRKHAHVAIHAYNKRLNKMSYYTIWDLKRIPLETWLKSLGQS